jgi:hypothetical protein
MQESVVSYMDLKWGAPTLHITLNWWLPDAGLNVRSPSG